VLLGVAVCSGLATGAGAIKSTDQREDFGGFANAQLDPCYHQYCDDVPNVSEEALYIVRSRPQTRLA